MLRYEIQCKLQLYVQSENAYRKAHEMPKKYNCCIISGIPGIGKTTSAEILSIYYLDQGYQIIKMGSDIQEALQAYHPILKQAFVYDDFLGSIGLEMKENKNEGKDLLKFPDFISKRKGKKAILATRKYILNQPVKVARILPGEILTTKNVLFRWRTTRGKIGPGSSTTISFSTASAKKEIFKTCC